MEVHVARAVKHYSSLLLVACGLLFAGPATAEPVTRTFAIVVANNRSLSLALPDLQYADDDAARYYRLFRAASAQGGTELLTTFDRTSALLYPSLKEVAKPPTRVELLRAVGRVRSAVLEARKKGERSQLYFVFAGHGEVAGGRGYVHLDDMRIDGTFIEREIIEKIPADIKHVLLDSCNSFFVINPRKPGGRRWATPKDMALGFSARHPEVGLFLSTNSDEEVFEWSELESGVFSHEVRSGLTGAADVNLDGNVTYAELAGFVAHANQGIVRENLRPQVYFNGPRGDRHARLFSLAPVQGRRVKLGTQQARIWMRGETGERLLDLHKETGELSVTLPNDEQAVSVFVQTSAAQNGLPPNLVELRLPAGSEPANVAQLEPHPPLLASRGDKLFGSLFASPYGPRAYAQYLETSVKQPEQVYGVKDEDITRMGNYLTALADVDNEQRRVAAVTFSATGGLLIAGGVMLRLTEPEFTTGAALGFSAVGAALGAAGLYYALSDGPAEQARLAFVAELRAQRGNRALAFAHTEQKLRDVAQAERSRRLFSFWLMQGLGVGMATVATVGLVSDEDRSQVGASAWLYGSAALMSGVGFLVLSMETPTERLLRLYRDDPGIKLRAGVTAFPNGGMGLGLSGSF
jgi:hypothetical protein